MAAEGDDVARRLIATPGVQRVPARALDLFVVRDFFDRGDCAALCAMIDAGRRPSTIADDLGDAYFRTSETCELNPADPLVAKLAGHANANVTLWHYTQAVRDGSAAIEALDRAYAT